MDDLVKNGASYLIEAGDSDVNPSPLRENRRLATDTRVIALFCCLEDSIFLALISFRTFMKFAKGVSELLWKMDNGL